MTSSSWEEATMPGKKALKLEDILKHPQVQKVTGDINAELLERRQYKPSICRAFTQQFTILKDTDQFKFKIDKEAQKQLPHIIGNKVQKVEGVQTAETAFAEQYRKKRNIGIVFSGGPAPGGHNVIAGLYDAVKKANPESKIFGFLIGPDGIIENEAIELKDELVDAYRNLGGFTMIKTGRTKIDTKEKMELSRRTCRELNLDALVIVGGDDSNTNAAFLAQEMFADGVQVIGVPKTIDGDIQVRDDARCPLGFIRLPGRLPPPSAICARTAVQMLNTGTSAKSWAVWPVTWHWKSLCRPMQI